MENDNSVRVRENAQKINQLEKSSQSAKIKSNTSDNVKDAITHEKYHADLILEKIMHRLKTCMNNLKIHILIL